MRTKKKYVAVTNILILIIFELRIFRKLLILQQFIEFEFD